MHDTPARLPLGFDPARDALLDLQSLRALSHPLRLHLRAELVTHGPATASQLAARLGVSSGLASYHLRQLGAGGFVADEPGRGSGRERYWRAVHRATYVEASEGVPASAGEVGAYLRAVAALYAQRVIRFAEAVDPPTLLGPAWSTAFTLSDWTLRLEPAQARDLISRVDALARAYRDHPSAGPAARLVTVQLQVMPRDAPDAQAP